MFGAFGGVGVCGSEFSKGLGKSGAAFFGPGPGDGNGLVFTEGGGGVIGVEGDEGVSAGGGSGKACATCAGSTAWGSGPVTMGGGGGGSVAAAGLVTTLAGL